VETGPGDRRGGGADASGVTVTSDDDGAVLQVAVRGEWDWRIALAVRTALNKCLAEHPGAVIVDLCEADDPGGSSAALLVTAHRVGRAMRPRVPVAVCLAPGSLLERRMRSRGAGNYLPLFPGLPQAHAAVDRDRAVPDRLFMRLQPTSEAPGQARRLVAEAGYAWDLPQLVQPAELVASELVTNVVRHAGTEMSVSLSRRRSGLYLAVCDGSPVLPPSPEGSGDAVGVPPKPHGYGLWLTDRIAAAWGARLTHGRTGKVVWAVVDIGRRIDRSPLRLHVTALSPYETLSAQEQRILEHLPARLSVDDIATRAGVSVNTMRAHLRSVYRKLGVSRRQEAVAEAIRRGLL
jgi:DNA-binding CsgD family transcriptional regulator